MYMVYIPQTRSTVLVLRVTPAEHRDLVRLAKREKTKVATLASAIIREHLEYLRAVDKYE
jgi:predicted HicB family RNase H-like nuclease